jgi:membrane protease YdiL (CAAX protease family)
MSMSARLRPVLEVAAVFIVLLLVAWGWNASSLGREEWDRLSGTYLSHTLFVLVPILLLILGRRSLRSWGLDLKLNWRPSLAWGLLFGAILAAAPLAALALGWTEIDVPRLWLSTIVFQVLFAGFGEEILFRGYFQSRLNEGFGRPFDAGGIRFGVGLVAISLLFGFAHVLNPFNPFLGHSALDWEAGLIALQTGLFYGLVREKTGSILAPAVIHGSTFWWDFLADGSARYIGMGIGWSICWVLLFTVFSSRKLADDDRASQPSVSPA